MAGHRRGRDTKTTAKQRLERGRELLNERLNAATTDRERYYAAHGFYLFALKHALKRDRSKQLAAALTNAITEHLIKQGQRLLEEQARSET